MLEAMIEDMPHIPPSGLDSSTRSWRGRLRTLLPAVAGITLSLLMFEAAFRLLLFGSEGRDPITHASITVGVHRLGEGFGVSHRDARGIRLSPHRCSICPQVLVIGDSYTEASQVDDDKVYTAVAETMLSGLRPVRLLNASTSGASPADYFVQATSYRRRFDPAWIVIQLNADDLGRDAFLPDKVHFRQNGDRLTPVVPSPYAYGRISRTLGFIRERSALANYAIGRLDIARSGANAPPWFRAGFNNRVHLSSSAPATYPLEHELDLLRAAYKGRVTFLFLPLFNVPVEVEELRFERYCGATHMSCVNFRASFDEFRRTGTAPYGFPNSRFGDGHLNAAGHAAVARQLADEIRRLQQNGLF
jgi:lysophospholipase L1-like esterase